MLVPLLAVSTRRLHDTDKSGWFLLIYFIPFGAIVLIYFMCSSPKHGINKWGMNPKSVDEEDYV